MTYEEVAKYLTQKYNEQSKGTAGHLNPNRVFVSQQLYDVYESGLANNVRFFSSKTDPFGDPNAFAQTPILAFKGTKMEAVKSLKDWEVVFGKVLKKEE